MTPINHNLKTTERCSEWYWSYVQYNDLMENLWAIKTTQTLILPCQQCMDLFLDCYFGGMFSVAQTDLDQGHFCCCFWCFGGPVSPGWCWSHGVVCTWSVSVFGCMVCVKWRAHECQGARVSHRILHTESWPPFFIFNSVVKMLMFNVSVISPWVLISFQSINSSHASQGKDIKLSLSSDGHLLSITSLSTYICIHNS